jgi:hypothetical protein
MKKEVLGVGTPFEWYHIDHVKSVNSPSHCEHDFFIPMVGLTFIGTSSCARFHFAEYWYSNTKPLSSPVTNIRNERSSLA